MAVRTNAGESTPMICSGDATVGLTSMDMTSTR
jgi:hypothetical protein